MQKKKKKPEPKIEITELFMAKAGWDRCFHGTIKRDKDDVNGNPVVRGYIKIHDGYILAEANDQLILGTKLDELVLMILDKELHENTGVFFNHNNFENSMN